MAYLLTGERPADAALPDRSFGGFVTWFIQARAARQRRVALQTLLEFDEHRLNDLGLSRQDILDALSRPERSGQHLASRRARSAKAWRRSP